MNDLLDYFDSIAEPVTADEARDRARQGRPSPSRGSLAIAAAAVAVLALVVVLVNLLDQTEGEVVAPTGATSIPVAPSETSMPSTEGTSDPEACDLRMRGILPNGQGFEVSNLCHEEQVQGVDVGVMVDTPGRRNAFVGVVVFSKGTGAPPYSPGFEGDISLLEGTWGVHIDVDEDISDVVSGDPAAFVESRIDLVVEHDMPYLILEPPLIFRGRDGLLDPTVTFTTFEVGLGCPRIPRATCSDHSDLHLVPLDVVVSEAPPIQSDGLEIRAVGSAGEATTTQAPTPESQPPTTDAEPPEPIWTYQGVSPGWMLDPGMPVIANPDLLTGVNADGNEVFALDLETGTERWRTSANDQTILLGGTASAVVVGDPNSVASLDAWTGDVQWRTELGSCQHPNGLAVTEDRVFISHDCPLEIDNKPLPGIVGLDRRSGAVVWETTLAGLEPSDGSDFELRLQPSGFTIADDALLVSVTRGAFALDAGTGDIRWVVEYGLADLDDLEGLDVPGPGVPENFNPAPIWVDGDTGYFPDPDGELVAVDIPSGDVVFTWEAPYGPVMALGKAGVQLLLADSDGVHAIDSTGSAVWDVEVEDTEAAAYYEGVIFAANRTGIAAITLDGEIQWQRALRDDPRYFVEGVDEGVVVAGESEVEYLDGTTGAIRRVTDTGAYAAPIAIDDKLVVVDSNSTISVYPRDVLR